MLTVNAGSSSLKLALVENGERFADEEVAARGGAFDPAEVERFAGSGFDCSSHRLVHGGTRFSAPALVDDDLRAELESLVDLAPLHMRSALAALDGVRELAPDRPAVACFDTAFHSTMPDAARVYGVPWDWTERYGLRRFGFHGLNHAYVARRAAQIVGRPLAELRIVSCHLGAGASLCAIVGGRSVDTTMGFTPLEGLVMATRSGDVDPGLVLWLEEHERLSPHEVATALEERSGLFALAGTADMREVLSRVDEGDAAATLALAVYVHRLVRGVAAMAAALGGLDVLVFTGGVGEHAPAVRAAAARGLAWIGVRMDENRNANVDADAEITGEKAQVRTFVVTAREDLQIARETRQLIADPKGVR